MDNSVVTQTPISTRTARTQAGTLAPRVRDTGSARIAAVLVWTLIVLMIVPEGFDYSALQTGNNPQSGDLLSRALWLGLLTGSVIIVFWRGTLSWLLLRRLNPFLIAFVALAVASVVWSVDPVLTVRRDVRLLTIVLTCMAFALVGWHPRRLQNIVRPVLTLMLLGSIVFGILAPELAIHQDKAPELAGAWRGLTNHKNSLGALAGVTFLLWLHGWSAREIPALRALLGCLTAAACLWLSRSATALVATIFAAAFFGLLTNWPRGLRPYLKYAIAIVALSLTVYALAMLHLIPGQRVLLAPITLLTGFDTTFTGRSEIWNIMTDQIALHPFLGVGYGAYWAGPLPQSPSYEFITRMNGFYPGTAHNGYLEVTNDLGWVGLLLLLGFMTVFLRQSLRLLVIDKPQATLCLVLFMHQALANLSESHWLSVLSVQFILVTLMTTSLARHLLEQQRLRRFWAAEQARRAQPAPRQSPAAAAAAAAWHLDKPSP